MIHRGYLYVASLDERRPVLVVSPDYRNSRAADVIIVPLSPVVRPSPTHVAIKAGEGGAPFSGMLHCEQIATLMTDLLDDNPLGAPLSGDRLAEVECAILRALGIAV